MVKRHLPSIEALTSSDDDLLFAELRLSDVREHLLLAREVLDEVERLLPVSGIGRVSEARRRDAARTAEELARLGCRFVELASALTRTEAANDAEPTSALRASS